MENRKRLTEYIRFIFPSALIGVLAYLGTEIIVESINPYLAILYLLVGLLADDLTTLKGLEKGHEELNLFVFNRTGKISKEIFIERIMLIDAIIVGLSFSFPGVGIGIGSSKLVNAGINLARMHSAKN